MENQYDLQQQYNLNKINEKKKQNSCYKKDSYLNIGQKKSLSSRDQ